MRRLISSVTKQVVLENTSASSKNRTGVCAFCLSRHQHTYSPRIRLAVEVIRKEMAFWDGKDEKRLWSALWELVLAIEKRLAHGLLRRRIQSKALDHREEVLVRARAFRSVLQDLGISASVFLAANVDHFELVKPTRVKAQHLLNGPHTGRKRVNCSTI